MTDAIVYRIFSLDVLIQTLESLSESDPEAVVVGLTGMVESYRGYYDRPATPPSTEEHLASRLAEQYSRQVGGTMHGYKGGEYSVQGDVPVYYAEWGSTGPNIIGLQKFEDGKYHLILLDDRYHYY